MTAPDGYFVLIGAAIDPTTTRLQARSIRYFSKNLNSKVGNWEAIVKLLEGEAAAVIVKLNRHNFEQMAGESGSELHKRLYAEHSRFAPRLVQAIANVPHLVLVHEDIITGSTWRTEAPEDWYEAGLEYEETLADSVRVRVLSLFDEHGAQMTVYRRNAEAAELAASFIDDAENNLLLRLYLPADRLFSEEASRLLDVFRDWLVTARGRNVRRAGYRTERGEVIEFFADSTVSREDLEMELSSFRRFVDLLTDPGAARTLLEGLGLSPEAAGSFVQRHGRTLRRIQTDMRHEQEQQLLTLRQAAESELDDEVSLDIAPTAVRDVLAQLLGGQAPLTPDQIGPRSGGHVVINQQVFHSVQGSVTQFIGSDVSEELIALIAAQDGSPFGSQLITAVHELGDAGIPRSRRTAAAAALRSFLLRARDRMEAEAFKMLFAWVERQSGL